MPSLKSAADVTVNDMFISVNRCEIGQDPTRTAVMQVMEEFGIKVHAIVTVRDLYEFLQTKKEYEEGLPKMEAYMKQYCLFED